MDDRNQVEEEHLTVLGCISADTAGSAGPQMEPVGYYLKTGLSED